MRAASNYKSELYHSAGSYCTDIDFNIIQSGVILTYSQIKKQSHSNTLYTFCKYNHCQWPANATQDRKRNWNYSAKTIDIILMNRKVTHIFC